MTHPEALCLEETVELLRHLGMPLAVPLVPEGPEVVQKQLDEPRGQHCLLCAILCEGGWVHMCECMCMH